MRTIHAILIALCLLSANYSLAQDQPAVSAATAWQSAQIRTDLIHNWQVVVPIDIPSDTLTHQTVIATAVLKQLVHPEHKVKKEILSTHQYILHGDLFGTGEIFALLEMPMEQESDPYWPAGRIAFLQYIDGDWKMRCLWNIEPEWRPSGWKSSPETICRRPLPMCLSILTILMAMAYLRSSSQAKSESTTNVTIYCDSIQRRAAFSF